LTTGAPIVVVGAGVIGLSAARALAERAAGDVVVLERQVIASGNTGRSSGVVRCHYGIRSLAAMAWQSLPVLANAIQALGDDAGYRRTGYLVGVGPADVESLHLNVAMQQSVGIDVQLVDHEAAAGLWPAARLDDFAGFAYEPNGGYGDGHQTALAFAGAARRAGARIRQQVPVAGIDQRGGRVAGVRTADGGSISASAVVLAAGPWSVPLASSVGIDLPIRAERAQVLIVEPPAADVGDLPVLSDLVSLQYVRPEGQACLLVGDSDHSEPEWADPDRYSDQPDDGRLMASIAKFGHRFPGYDGARLRSVYAGCYDVTPDYNPIISPTPLDGLWVCAGFSGHGYKISPAVGELIADLVLYGEGRLDDVDHRDFRLERFSEGAPLASPHPYAAAAQMR
jgi:glycine/D-amino acid oxidase-like deaminating enzyme